MGASKITGLTILSILLVLSLFAVGTGIAVKMTVLRPAFITGNLNRLPVSSLADDALTNNNLPEGVKSSITSSIVNLEPLIKQQAAKTVNQVYDYLLGDVTNLDLAVTIRETLLDQNTVHTIIDNVNVSTIAAELIDQNFNSIVPAGVPPQVAAVIRANIAPAMAAVEPSLKNQLQIVSGPALNYVFGLIPNFSVTLDMSQVISNLRDVLGVMIVQSPPPELAAIPVNLRSAYVDQFINDLTRYLPASYTFDETAIGSEVRSNVLNSLNDAEAQLVTAHQNISVFQTWYIIVIILTVLEIAGIILLYRRIKGSALNIGLIFLLSGLIEFVAAIVSGNITRSRVALIDMPASLPNFLYPLIIDVFRPMLAFGLGLMVAGAILVIIAIFYQRGSPYSGNE